MNKSEGRLSKSGDLLQPIQQRVISREHIVGTLADLVQGIVPARTSPHEITLYKSVGYTVSDLTVAQIVYEQIRGQVK
jgi:ornithine cyclodeaminase/alanine dehydrogenase-like protein (mu-crystallin family)